MNYSTMELVGGYDEGQDAAVNDELHGELVVVGVQVRLYQWLENRFVCYVVNSKLFQSSSCFSLSRVMQNNVF